MRSLMRTFALAGLAVMCIGGLASTAPAVLPCGSVSALAVDALEISQAGTINVNSVPAGATFSLRGPAKYSGTAPWKTDAAPGFYTISWGNMSGWTKPSNEIKILTDGGSITFAGNYVRQAGTINVNSVPAGAAFSLSGAESYSGTAPWSTSAAPKGSYTISWGDMSGWAKPSNETKTLTDGGGITFTGNYVQHVAAINVNSVPAGAAFSLSGAASYSGTAPWSTGAAPKGSYTISWGDLAGYTKPSGETKTLTDGGSITFTGNYVDAVAPVFYGVGATDISGTTANIIWSSNEASTSQVEYGLTTGYGSSTTLAPALVQSHTVALTGLSPKTAYHYRVKSTDASGNPSQSADCVFTTADIDAPMISDVRAGNITGTDATITWTTDDPAESQVEYGTSTGYGLITAGDYNRVTEHSTNLTGLSAQTTYHYKVKSRDASGLWSESADFTFTTGGSSASGNQGQSEDLTFDATAGEGPTVNLPTWAWAVIGLALALVVGAAIVRGV